MKEYSAAVWAHHGLFCTGSDFDETFGLMHTIEAAAAIYVKVLSTGLPIKQTISDKNLRAIGAKFRVTLNEAFLDS
jgi:rhamnulose-1-phosphate aldolase